MSDKIAYDIVESITKQYGDEVWIGSNYGPGDELRALIAHAIAARDTRVAELQAIVDKLPKYADTGQPFVPGVDECWWAFNGRSYHASPVYYNANIGWVVSTLDDNQTFYSTPAAALAAKDKP